ncbi:MAG: hypothetical protein ABTD50_24595 [Polyangiaceae bacterium]
MQLHDRSLETGAQGPWGMLGATIDRDWNPKGLAALRQQLQPL